MSDQYLSPEQRAEIKERFDKDFGYISPENIHRLFASHEVADARFVELTSAIDQLRHTCEAQRVALADHPKRRERGFGSTDEQARRIAVLEDALKPFAYYAEVYIADPHVLVLGKLFSSVAIHGEHFVKARAAIGEKT